jgi:hypothetical protein
MAPVSEPGRIYLGPEDTELEGESEYCVVNTCEAGGLEAEVEVEVEVEAPELSCPISVSLQSQEAQTLRLTLTQTLTCERHEGAVDPGSDIPLKSLVVRVGGRAGSSVRGLIEADTACLVRWIGSMILAEATLQTLTQRQREALALIKEPSVHSPSSPPTVSAVLGNPAPLSSPSSSSSPPSVQVVKTHKVGDGLCDVDPDPHSPSACSAADTVVGGRAGTHAPAPTPSPADREAVSRNKGREKWRESQGGRGGDRAIDIQQQRLERLEGSRCWCALQQGTRDSCLAAIRSMRYQTDPSSSSSSTSTTISIPPFGLDSEIDHSDKDKERYTQRQRDKGRSCSTSDSSSSRKKDRDIDHRSNGSNGSSSSSSSSRNSNGSTSAGPVRVGGRGGGVVPPGESERSDPVADLSHRLLSLLSADTHTHCKSFRTYLPGPWTCTCTSGPGPGPACAGCSDSRGVGEGPRDGDKGQKYSEEVEEKEFEVEVEVEVEGSSSVRSMDYTIERERKSVRKSAAELLMASLQQYGVGDRDGDGDGDGDGEVLDRDRVLGMISCLRSHIRVCTVPYCFVLC